MNPEPSTAEEAPENTRSAERKIVGYVAAMVLAFGVSNGVFELLPAPTASDLALAQEQVRLAHGVLSDLDRLADPTSVPPPAVAQSIAGRMNRLHTHEQQLIDGDPQDGIPPLRGESLRTLYLAEGGLAEQRKNLAEQIESITGDGPGPLVHGGVGDVQTHTRAYADALIAATAEHKAAVDHRYRVTRWVVHSLSGLQALFALLLGHLVLRPVLLRYREESAELVLAHQQQVEESSRRSYEATLSRALDMSLTEGQVLEVTSRALAMIDRDRPSELLLSDSSTAHMRLGAADAVQGSVGCPVATPFECPAIRQGQTMTFDSSTGLDACPYLRERLEECSAVCTPVSFMGQALGVLHQIGPAKVTPNLERVQKLRTLGVQVGTRLGTVRSFAKVEHQAERDPLTGLLNRRALGTKMTTLNQSGQSFSLAVVDLDNFKRLNDTYGHDAGDSALLTFAKVVTEVCRDGDLLCRWGGEEFVLVWPGQPIERAVQIANRIRDRLAQVCLSQPSHPTFTGSFGVAVSTEAATWKQAVSLADKRLLDAKKRGRNCVVSGEEGPEQDAGASTSPAEEQRANDSREGEGDVSDALPQAHSA